MHKEYLILWDDYIIYKDGRIWSKRYNRFLKCSVLPNGYVQVTLKCVDGNFRKFYWHRVIYTYFNGDIPEGYQVNHIDENKQNNTLSNLNLMTPIDNINYGTGIERCAAKRRGKHHTEKHKTKISAKLIGHKVSKETKEKIAAKQSKAVVALDKDGNVVMEFASTQEAGRNGFDQVCVSTCCRNCYGKLGNYFKGYRWYYKEDYLKIKGDT